VTLPQAYGDPSFEAFRKQISDIASHKDSAALAKLLVNTFFWMGERGDRANKRKPGIDNLAAAINLDGNEGSGWEILAAAANEATLEPVPEGRDVQSGAVDLRREGRPAERQGDRHRRRRLGISDRGQH
jgi:hypothetical protein